MNNIVFLYADFTNKYLSEKIFDNKSAFQCSLDWALQIQSSSKIVVLSTDIEIANKQCEFLSEEIQKKVLVHKLNSKTVTELLSLMSSLSASFDNALYLWADCPFVNSELTDKLLAHHQKSLAEYTFADGYAYGITPEIIHPGTLKILLSLSDKSTKINQKIQRDSIFEVLKTDINSFEIETIISDKDYRNYRFSFSCDNKYNTMFCKNSYEIAKKNNLSCSDILKICDIAIQSSELLVTLPTFYNIQIIDSCSGSCSFCPYPKAYQNKYSCNVSETKKVMSFNNFSSIIDNIVAFSGEAVIDLSLWGEPILHPELSKFIQKILSYSGLSVVIELSGEQVNEKLIDEIKQIENQAVNRTNNYEKIYWIISLDACDFDSYKELHGENKSNTYDNALKTIELLNKMFPKTIYPQFIRLQENENQLEKFYRYWNEKNAGNVIIQKYDWCSGFLPQKKVADLAPLNRNPCWHLRRDFCILTNGDVPLCKSELLANSQGNVFVDSLETIWNKRKELLEKQLQNNYSLMCKECDEYYTFNF